MARSRFARNAAVLGLGLALLHGCAVGPARAAQWRTPPASGSGGGGPIGAAPSPSDPPGSSPPKPPAATPTPKPPAAKPPAPPRSGSGGPAGSIIRTGSSAVALTFDDGPDPGNTPAMLDLLKQFNVKATFCLVGFRARDNPDLVRRIAAEGHTICNHSWQHLMDLGKRTPDYIAHDLAATSDAIHAAVPGVPIKYFRAPGGNFTPALVAQARAQGMAPIYWAVDPRDWDAATYGTGQSMTNHIAAVVERDVRPGFIVLSHDNKKPDTTAAYRVLLPWLREHGFTLIALPT